MKNKKELSRGNNGFETRIPRRGFLRNSMLVVGAFASGVVGLPRALATSSSGGVDDGCCDLHDTHDPTCDITKWKCLVWCCHEAENGSSTDDEEGDGFNRICYECYDDSKWTQAEKDRYSNTTNCWQILPHFECSRYVDKEFTDPCEPAPRESSGIYW